MRRSRVLLLTLTGIDRALPVDPSRRFHLGGRALIQKDHVFATRRLVTAAGESALVNDINIRIPGDFRGARSPSAHHWPVHLLLGELTRANRSFPWQ